MPSCSHQKVPCPRLGMGVGDEGGMGLGCVFCLQGSHLTGFCSPHSHCFPVICPSGGGWHLKAILALPGPQSL